MKLGLTLFVVGGVIIFLTTQWFPPPDGIALTAGWLITIVGGVIFGDGMHG